VNKKDKIDKVEEIRIRYKYRELILKSKINLPIEAMKNIIGPDCGYHLYKKMDTKSKDNKNDN